MPPDLLERAREQRDQPYRDGLCRTAPFELLRADDTEDGDGLTIAGYGAVFNTVTHISSWEGDFDEVIAPGAFRKSLRERTPKMQFDHGRHPLLGSLPLGVWTTAQEDHLGLDVEGRLTDNWLIQPFRDAIRDGAVDGMSFRFSVVREEWTDKDGKKIQPTELWELLWSPGDRGPILRTLKELSVTEVGPVVWPAYEATTVGVRSKIVIDLASLGTEAGQRQVAQAICALDVGLGKDPTRALAQGHRWSLIEAGMSPQDAWRLADRTQTPDAQPSGAPTEPRSTAGTAADEHPSPEEPPVTAGPAAGEHSSAWERRNRIRAEISRTRGAMQKINEKE